MAGDEVVQSYRRDDVSSVTRPVKELVGFRRVTLKPGETRQVAIPIRPDAFALWNADMERVVEPGSFTIMAGARSAEVKDAKLTRSEEHTSELQSLMRNSYAVFCLKKKKP